MTTKSESPEAADRRDKLERPHAHFVDPMAVVKDRNLTPSAKAHVLDALEQDARQIAIASNEGMPDGGEPNRLRTTKLARQALRTQRKGRAQRG